MKTPLVTVAIITYNSDKFIKETLESVINQTYQNWKIVVGDDGSKDKTVEILREYKEKLGNKIELILAKENKGANENWNNITPYFTGDYVAKLDGDDLWLPEKLGKQVKYMESNKNVTLLYHYTYIKNDLKNEVMKVKQERLEGNCLEVFLENGCFLYSCTAMWKNKKKIYVPKNLKKVGDYYLWMALGEGGDIGCIPEYLSEYRLHGANVTIADNKIKYLEDNRRIIDYFSEKVNQSIYKKAVKNSNLDIGIFYYKKKKYLKAKKVLKGIKLSEIKGWKRKLAKLHLLFK